MIRIGLIAVSGTVLVLAAVLAFSAPAVAKKPSPPPPSPDPVDTGVIYAVDTPNMVVMDTDGTDRTQVGFRWGPIPSTALHDGKRWFLVLKEIEGETYPSGNPRHELFAVTTAGDAVQLTDDPDIEPNYLNGWIYGNGERQGLQWTTCDGVTDGRCSYLAVRWENETIVEYGIYVLDVDPDDLSSHTAVSCGAGASFLPLGVILEHPESNVPIFFWRYDWSPDGESVVFEYTDSGVRSGILVAHSADSWNVELLTDTGYDSGIGYVRCPSWSPDGTLIAVGVARDVSSYPYFVWDIYTIEPDGSNETRILTAGDREWIWRPKWSPSGDYLVYTRESFPRREPKGGGLVPDSVDVYRAAADGSGVVNLTGDADGKLTPLAWVEN